MKHIKITAKNDGSRLDLFLKEEIASLSRNQLQKLIKEGLVTVNKKAVQPHHFLKINDTIEVASLERNINTEKKSGGKNPDIKIPKYKIIKANDDYLILNKPAGIAVHGASHMKGPNLIDILIKKYPEISKVGSDPDRPGIVHRLDKDVSGLMVIARNQDSYDSLAGQFRKRTITKKYIALAHGKIIKDEDIIDFPIDRASKGYKMAAKPLNQPGKRALTEFKVIHRYINYTLAEIKIITGRTHQIRVHFAAYSHPIVGDNLYSTKKYRDLNKRLDLGRIFLASTELSFIDLDGEKKAYKINLPNELKKFLEKVK